MRNSRVRAVDAYFRIRGQSGSESRIACGDDLVPFGKRIQSQRKRGVKSSRERQCRSPAPIEGRADAAVDQGLNYQIFAFQEDSASVQTVKFMSGKRSGVNSIKRKINLSDRLRGIDMQAAVGEVFEYIRNLTDGLNRTKLAVYRADGDKYSILA